MPREPVDIFAPLSWFPLGNGQSVRLASPRFPKWIGPSPGSDYGGKPICDFEGRPAFGELWILWACIAEGWHGVWVTHAGGKAKYRQGFWGPVVEVSVPEDVQDFLNTIATQRGGTVGGTWDLVLWDPSPSRKIPDDLRFIEAKYGADKVKPAQIEWYTKVREAGSPKTAFLLVEWSQTTPRRAAT